MANTATWQTQSTITLNQPGSYAVVYELWHYNYATSAYEFTSDYAIIKHPSFKLSFLVFFCVLFFDCDSVDVVVGAERYDFLVGGNVVDYASADSVNIEVVGVHERHAAQKEDASADFSQRLIRRRQVHSHYRVCQRQHTDFPSD